ncbi:MAG: hypothetical protein HY040_20620 [Planctomycetes bacterium]|nr:hypothetical protein [Planctomycetota bacterium]
MIAVARQPETYDPLLLPPRDAAYRLHDVFEKKVDGCRDELILDFGDCILTFEVDIDTDTISGQFQRGRFKPTNGYESVQAFRPWKKYIGKQCGWTWFAVNQQGYVDSALISFEGIEPNILLHVIASSMELFVINAMPRAIASVKKKGRKPSAKARK